MKRSPSRLANADSEDPGRAEDAQGVTRLLYSALDAVEAAAGRTVEELIDSLFVDRHLDPWRAAAA
jgi:hypothetical protein